MANDFDKIGVNVIRPFKFNGRWVFSHNGHNYDFAPASMVEAGMSPLLIGADRLISVGCQLKGIQNPENGFLLLFSEEYFPNADVKFVFTEIRHNGWLFNIEELNLKGIMPGQAAWICSYMSFYFKDPPKSLYIKLESDESNGMEQRKAAE